MMSQEVEEGEFYDEGYVDDERVVENRIKFSKTRMYGREKELQSLHRTYDRVCSKKSTEVVLISGYSGAGKSALVKKLADDIRVRETNAQNQSAVVNDTNNNGSNSRLCETKRSFFLSGKFDDLQSSDPFSAIVQAFSGFANDLLSQDADVNELQQIRKSVIEGVGSEARVLIDLVPSLSSILNDSSSGVEKDTKEDRAPDTCTSSSVSKQNMWNRLTYFFKQFVKTICSEGRAVILFLDDLQWADTPSIQLMTSLIQDSSVQKFMLIGAIRSNEVGNNHPLHNNFISLVEQTKKIRRLELLNLSLEDINIFISDTLDLDAEVTLPLTRAVHNKTRGNIFFTMQALEEWNRRNVIYFSTITFQWEWNLKEVEVEGQLLSDDVVGVVAARIRSAPALIQEALTLASYTRSTFDVDTLLFLFDTVGNEKIEMEKLLSILDTAVMEGFLTNVVGSKEYTFAHDRIQQAVYFLVPTRDDRDELRMKIGLRLLKRGFSDAGEDWMLFVAADHLNHSKDRNNCSTEHYIEQPDPLDLANLNLFVGEKSMLVAAFAAASGYFGMAHKIVTAIDDYWKVHYELTMRLLRATMDVELALGNYGAGHSIGQEVLDNARTTDDALPTYMTFALSLARQERNRDAVDLCMVALDTLCNIPKRFYFVHAMIKLKLIKKLLKQHSDEDILRLPKLKDERLLLMSQFLQESGRQAFLCGDLFLSLFCLLRNMELGFEHGLCSYHAGSYVGYALLMTNNFGEYETGRRVCELAKEIMKRHDEGKEIQSSVYIVSGASIDAWTHQAKDVLETFRKGHIAGMQCGDVEFGFRNRVLEIYFRYLSGDVLLPIEKAGADVLDQALRHNLDSVSGILSEMMFLFQHLLGRASQASTLNWNEITSYGVGREGKDGDGMKILQGLISRLQLAVYFDELEAAERLSETASQVYKIDSRYHILVIRLYFGGLTASGLFRKTGRRKYKTWAEKNMLQMKNVQGGENRHYYALMQADFIPLLHGTGITCRTGRGISNTVAERPMDHCSLYDKAIVAALGGGYIQDAALGNELAGKHLLSVGDSNSAGKYLNQARDYYVSWGATKKVEHLEKKYEKFLKPRKTLSKVERVPSTGSSCGFQSSSMFFHSSSNAFQLSTDGGHSDT